MRNYDVIKDSVGGSPEGAAAFMIEIFILGFNLAVECMETGDMAPGIEVLERYFLWFLSREAEKADEAQELPEDMESRKEAARAEMDEIRKAMESGERSPGKGGDKN